jgi:hypothetical protein
MQIAFVENHDFVCAFAMAVQTLSGVAGMSMCSMP